MTLAEFLLARIAEDERHARKLAEVDRRPVLSLATTVNHPLRVIAECEAKRRIVELHYVGDPEQWDPEQWACRLCQWDEDCDSPKHDGQHGAGRFPCDTLRALALPYADHPDCRREWIA